MSRLTRRQLLRLGAGGLLAAGLWPGALDAADAAAGDFHFLVVNDVHYVDGKCGDWLAKVVKGMKARPEKVEFALLAGDLAEHGTKAQLGGARDAFKGLGVPVHVVVGNHDYQKGHDRKAFEGLFGKAVNYVFEHRGWQILGLDSSHGTRSRVAVQPDTLKWLDDKLPKLDKKKPTVVFTHFPLGPKVPNVVTNTEVVLNRFKAHNLVAVFSGHHHGRTERKAGAAVLTTNACCSLRSRNHDGSKAKAYFVCRAKGGAVTRTFVEVKTG